MAWLVGATSGKFAIAGREALPAEGAEVRLGMDFLADNLAHRVIWIRKGPAQIACSEADPLATKISSLRKLAIRRNPPMLTNWRHYADKIDC